MQEWASIMGAESTGSGKPDAALDLETIKRATELSREESFEEMDIIVTYDDPSCELVLPLRRKKELTNPCVRPLKSSSRSAPSVTSPTRATA